MGHLTYISYGAGVQSTALLVCSNLGLHGVPRADVAIFADTHDEPGWVYETLENMRRWSEIPVVVVSAGPLLQHAVERNQGKPKRFACIPLFTPGNGSRVEGRGRRQCTREYKIEPIEREVRRRLGVAKGQRIGSNTATAMIGISLDEVVRMKPNRRPWVTNAWPLVDARLRREDCTRIVEERLGFTPRRSSCVYCPYHSDRYWRWLKQQHPEEWARATEADELLRDMTTGGLERPAFLHRSLKPLRDANLNEDQMDLFGEECEGICGV